MVNIDKFFVIKKPLFISSNRYLMKIKREFGVKKAGFSGTLDPFATGVLITAFGKYTKLFRFLKKAPKRYKATLWIGAVSKSLDIENIIALPSIYNSNFTNIKLDTVKTIIESFYNKTITYLPPKYSAKKIDGKRAYNLARDDDKDLDLKLKEIETKIFDIKLINFNYPFLTFEISVSEGGYIRSIAQMIADKLGVDATLSALERLNEDKFKFDNYKELNPLDYLNIPENFYTGDIEWFKLGKKLQIEYFKNQSDGFYHIVFNEPIFDKWFAIIEIKDNKVHYVINQINL